MRKKETEKMVDSGLEFLKALNLVTEEKGISKDLIMIQELMFVLILMNLQVNLK